MWAHLKQKLTATQLSQTFVIKGQSVLAGILLNPQYLLSCLNCIDLLNILSKKLHQHGV